MSEVRKALEDTANNANGMLKMFKFCGWSFVVIGVMLCISVVGIPVGLILIGAGYCLIKVLPNILQKKFDTAGKAFAEQAEIHEFNLAKARAARQEESAK